MLLVWNVHKHGLRIQLTRLPVNMLPDPHFQKHCPKCGRTTRFLQTDGAWSFYDCPVHRTIVIASSPETHARQMSHEVRRVQPSAQLGVSRDAARHPGIDQPSWEGFEARIRTRRFEALIAQAHAALAGDDVPLAQHALNEARDLSPNDPAVAQLNAAVARRRPQEPVSQTARRAVAAAAVLVIGVALILGVDRLRPATLAPTGSIGDRIASLEETSSALDATDAVRRRAEAAVSPSIAQDRPRVAVIVPTATLAASARATSPSTARQTMPSGINAETVSGGPKLASRGGIAPTTIDVPQQSTSMREPDGAMPGAPVAFVLSDAAAQVAASAGSSDAAMSLTRLAAVLRRYAEAYGELNVSATRQLWPSVDELALTNAFDRAASRDIALDACNIDVQGSTASASCRGNARLAAGGNAAPSEARLWRFDLRRDGDDWKIESAETTPR